MAHIYATIKISNMERTKVTAVQALADTGARLAVIAQKIAQELELGQSSDLSLRGTVVPKQSQTEAGVPLTGSVTPRKGFPQNRNCGKGFLALKGAVKTGAGKVELRRSLARISINGKEAVQDVLISDFIDRVLLGVVTLATLALSLDPLTGKLKEEMLLLY